MALTLHGTVSDNTVALDRKTATPLIINGDMAIAQRGTSVTGVTGSGSPVVIDRFRNVISSLGTWTVSQSTDVPTGQGFTNSFKMDCTTAETSPSASSYNTLSHRFEGQNLQMLKKGTSSAESVTVSFWVNATKTGTNIVELYDQDNARQISQAYTIDSANTWEKKVLSFAGDTTGALDNDNAFSMQIQFWLGAGSDRTSGTLNTSWASITNANRVVGQVNHADSTSNDWYITGVQLEVGTFDSNSIPPFQFEDRATSLARCQRYFQIQVSGSTGSGYANGSFRTNNNAQITHHFRTEMRANPTCTQIAGSNMIAHDTADGNNITITSIDSLLYNSNGGAIIAYNLSGTSAAAGDGCWIYNTGSTPGITFDSEL